MKWIGWSAIRHVNHLETSPCMYGDSPDYGFDCSGLVSYLCRQIYFPLDSNIRHANEFFDKSGPQVHLRKRKEGDLVFFSGKGNAPTHMGILLDKNYYIHSPGKDGSRINIARLIVRHIRNTSEDAFYDHNPIGFRRLLISGSRWFQTQTIPLNLTDRVKPDTLD